MRAGKNAHTAGNINTEMDVESVYLNLICAVVFDILFILHRFKKCKEEGMTYNNCDDSGVQIPKEMFEARQRQLSEVTCIKNQSNDSIGATTRRKLGSKIRNRNTKLEFREVEKVIRYMCLK